MVCLPKAQGGLGVINLTSQNEALLLKNLHKFFNRLDILWVHLIWEKHYQNDKLPSTIKKGSFWWKDNLKLLDKFKGLASVNLSYGRTCLLWWDLWDNQVCAQVFPELFSFSKIKNVTIQKVLSPMSIDQLFHLPLSSEAYAQLLLLNDKLDSLQLSNSHDIWNYIWGSPYYSSSKAYKQLTGQASVHASYKWLWKNCCQHKHKVFFWLLLKDRLSTRDLLERKGMILQSHECVLCNQHSRETLEHLFLTCPFATQFWASLGLLVPVFQEHVQVVSSFRRQLNIPFFMEIIILGCWGIWMSRNDFIFRQLTPSVQGGQGILKKELALATHRAKNSIKEQFQAWINNHL